MLTLLVVAALAVSTTVTIAYPTGPPVDTIVSLCGEMRPYHNYTATQTTPAPYKISVNTSDCYTPQQPINVILSSLDGAMLIRGFFMQARKSTEATMSYGTFSAAGNADVSPLSCFGATNNGIGHNTRIDKPRTHFVWTASAMQTGDLQLTTTVVQEFFVFWVQRVNLTLSQCSDASSTGQAGSVATLLTAALLCLLTSAFDRRLY